MQGILQTIYSLEGIGCHSEHISNVATMKVRVNVAEIESRR